MQNNIMTGFSTQGANASTSHKRNTLLARSIARPLAVALACVIAQGAEAFAPMSIADSEQYDAETLNYEQLFGDRKAFFNKSKVGIEQGVSSEYINLGRDSFSFMQVSQDESGELHHNCVGHDHDVLDDHQG